MRRAPRVSQSPFEVRCPRCDVSFPVGTKDCIHCGGKTGPPGAMPSMSTAVDTGSDFDPGATAAEPSAFGGFDPVDGTYSDPNLDAAEDRGSFGMGELDDDHADEAQSPMRAILSSLGGMVWILLFIVISIARSCGE